MGFTEDDASDHDADEATPMDPVPARAPRRKVLISQFQILDKQLFAADNKMMYWVDYTDASLQSDWKYREDIEREFGQLGERMLDEYNEANRDKEVYTVTTVDLLWICIVVQV